MKKHLFGTLAFTQACSCYAMDSIDEDNGSGYIEPIEIHGVAPWIPEINQAAFNETHTIENLEYKELNLADVVREDFWQLQYRIYTYTNVWNYTFDRDSGNLSNVRCDEGGLRDVCLRRYNNDWNRFIKDIKNYFAAPRAINGHTLYSPNAFTQRTDIERSKKENAVTFLKLLDLAFKKNDGTGGLSLRFGYEVINIFDNNAKDRIITHTIEEIEAAAGESIGNVYPLYLRERGDYSQALLNIGTMFQMATNGIVETEYSRHIIDAVRCILGRRGAYDSELYKPENFSKVNYSFDVFQRLYDLLKTGQGEVDAEIINISLGQLIEFSQHCTAGQAQGIAQLFEIAVSKDKWILPNLRFR